MLNVMVAAVVAAVAAPAPDRTPEPSFDCAMVREYSSCAVGVGALTGRIIASALACGLPRERLAAVAAMMAAIIAEVAADEADLEEGMFMITVSGKEALDHRRTGADPEPCHAVARDFDALAQEMGVP